MLGRPMGVELEEKSELTPRLLDLAMKEMIILFFMRRRRNKLGCRHAEGLRDFQKRRPIGSLISNFVTTE